MEVSLLSVKVIAYATRHNLHGWRNTLGLWAYYLLQLSMTTGTSRLVAVGGRQVASDQPTPPIGINLLQCTNRIPQFELPSF